MKNLLLYQNVVHIFTININPKNKNLLNIEMFKNMYKKFLRKKGELIPLFNVVKLYCPKYVKKPRNIWFISKKEILKYVLTVVKKLYIACSRIRKRFKNVKSYCTNLGFIGSTTIKLSKRNAVQGDLMALISITSSWTLKNFLKIKWYQQLTKLEWINNIMIVYL